MTRVLATLKAAWFYYWSYLLGIPLGPIRQYLGVDLSSGWRLLIYRLVASLLVFFLLYEVFTRTRNALRRAFGKDDLLEDVTIGPSAASGKKDEKFTAVIEGARNLKATIAPLKHEKRYDRIAEIYAELKRPAEAARWFARAGDRKQAAAELAKAGQTVKAAKLLMREGSYAEAARFYEEKGKYAQAAEAYLKLNDLPKAGGAYVLARKYAQAAGVFERYFETNADAQAAQFGVAEAALAFLDNPAVKAKLSDETRKGLLPMIALRFARAKRLEPAARLFKEAGDTTKAGEAYMQAGMLREAAQCLREGGKTREANQVTARHYETQGHWAEAGLAYMGVGELQRAGDCFSKANDAARAADCYEKAGEHYGAALAYAHLKRYKEAIRQLQRLTETDPRFDESRALLGRCFFELHDYEHCVATLDNHLTGRRVETNNVDYFYMLALALEQTGKLDRSRELLQKIRSVNLAYKDVTQRISSISSRISMGHEPAPSKPGVMATVASDGGFEAPQEPTTDNQVMSMVQSLLGGRYRLDNELGRGGMGVVYQGWDVNLDRPVALKFLGSLVDDSEEFRERFVREAKAAAKVNHPNIISVYDISANRGKAYIAMEFVEGTNLSRYLRQKGALAPREAVNIIAQACSALNAIHQAGIVHRDIKPDNILLGKGGIVKLTDFGLAKADAARMTAANVVMGTPPYMSPEQTESSDVDARSDIYSIGLVLHEALTGRVVFGSGDIMQRQREEAPPPPSASTEGIPERLDGLVMKCIEKDPEQRYQNVAELLADLRKWNA